MFCKLIFSFFYRKLYSLVLVLKEYERGLESFFYKA